MNTAATKLLYEMEQNRDTCLVLIISQDGSAPRGSGSFMLVGEAGHLVGTIGGGAVEKRSEERALECISTKRSEIHTYQLNSNQTEDIGMVCGGEVRVYFQYISASDESWKSIAKALIRGYQERCDGWLVLDIKKYTALVMDTCGNVLAGEPCNIKCPEEEGCRGEEGYFFMPLNTGERVILFGAGHCGLALAPILNSVGFRVIVFDNRPEFADASRFPSAEQVICGDYEHIADSISMNTEDYIVIMTSGHSYDYVVECQALAEKKAYIGVIGSHKKIAAVNKRLADAGISEDVIAEVYTPIGVPIKAVTPEEIAVSIAGEMIRVRANHRQGIDDHPTHQSVH